jgi:hypothetical protein
VSLECLPRLFDELCEGAVVPGGDRLVEWLVSMMCIAESHRVPIGDHRDVRTALCQLELWRWRGREDPVAVRQSDAHRITAEQQIRSLVMIDELMRCMPRRGGRGEVPVADHDDLAILDCPDPVRVDPRRRVIVPPHLSHRTLGPCNQPAGVLQVWGPPTVDVHLCPRERLTQGRHSPRMIEVHVCEEDADRC